MGDPFIVGPPSRQSVSEPHAGAVGDLTGPLADARELCRRAMRVHLDTLGARRDGPRHALALAGRRRGCAGRERCRRHDGEEQQTGEQG